MSPLHMGSSGGAPRLNRRHQLVSMAGGAGAVGSNVDGVP